MLPCAGPTIESALDRFRRTFPYRALATDDFARGAYRADRSEAVQRAEVAPDAPGWLSSLRFDVDSLGGGAAWIEANLPPPNLIVTNPRNGHAHLIYMLAVWVRLDADDTRAERFANAIDRAMTSALGADPAYCGRFHHSPCSSQYVTKVGRNAPYSLAELAQHVDLYLPTARRKPTARGEGRNCDVFHELRHWAYRSVSRFRAGGRDAWEAAVRDRAAEINASVAGRYDAARGPLSTNELGHIVKSVARWVWARFTGTASTAELEARAIVQRIKDRERAIAARRSAGKMPRETYIGRAAQRFAETLKLAADGTTAREIASRLGIALRTVQTYIARATQSPSGPSELGERARPPEVLEAVEPATIAPESASLPKTAAWVRAILRPERRRRRPERVSSPPSSSLEVDEPLSPAELLQYARMRIGSLPENKNATTSHIVALSSKGQILDVLP